MGIYGKGESGILIIERETRERRSIIGYSISRHQSKGIQKDTGGCEGTWRWSASRVIISTYNLEVAVRKIW